MTAQEIADRYLLSTKGPTDLRLQKAKKLAERSNVDWDAVQRLIDAHG